MQISKHQSVSPPMRSELVTHLCWKCTHVWERESAELTLVWLIKGFRVSWKKYWRIRWLWTVFMFESKQHFPLPLSVQFNITPTPLGCEIYYHILRTSHTVADVFNFIPVLLVPRWRHVLPQCTWVFSNYCGLLPKSNICSTCSTSIN